MATQVRSIRRDNRAKHWVDTRRAQAQRTPRYGATTSRPPRPERPVIESRVAPCAGPYETSYDIAFGYGMERQILRP